MASNIAGLVAQTLLEGGVVAWAGWEIWSLRTRKTSQRADPPADDAAPSDEPHPPPGP